ncbi:hypothetical protein DLAC_02750 [Tieghemostelium lacteum]|uniref:Uncharacterized protein n=1 Tax=Tieghemostelium lacteum TaxID=361077 RepID=A0A152A3C3_TIELA|nr:hypothetical protein DLAC_02750 [Tieghemostelium lacteum]|eukprot:KYR00710.1 hypothetical protein DLAC_02750 [Tieghemostelium lacteum]
MNFMKGMRNHFDAYEDQFDDFDEDQMVDSLTDQNKIIVHTDFFNNFDDDFDEEDDESNSNNTFNGVPVNQLNNNNNNNNNSNIKKK